MRQAVVCCVLVVQIVQDFGLVEQLRGFQVARLAFHRNLAIVLYVKGEEDLSEGPSAQLLLQLVGFRHYNCVHMQIRNHYKTANPILANYAGIQFRLGVDLGISQKQPLMEWVFLIFHIMMAHNSFAVDELIQSINTLLKVRIRMNSMLAGTRITRQSFLRNNSQAKKWRVINDDIAKNKENVAKEISQLYQASAHDKIWNRVIARINQSLWMVLGTEAQALDKSTLGNSQQLEKVVESLVSKNVELIRTFFKSIYSLQLQRKTLLRKSNLRRSSRFNIAQCRDLLKILQALVEANRQVMPNKANLVDMVSKLDDLQMEYDIPVEDNLRNLNENMLARNKNIKVTINTYAYDYWCRRKSMQNSSKISSQKSLSSENSKEIQIKEAELENELFDKELCLLEELTELKEQEDFDRDQLNQKQRRFQGLIEELSQKKLTSSDDQDYFPTNQKTQIFVPTQTLKSPYVLGRYSNQATARRKPKKQDLFVKNLTLDKSSQRQQQLKSNQKIQQNGRIIQSPSRKLKILNRNIMQTTRHFSNYPRSQKRSLDQSRNSPSQEKSHVLWSNTDGFIRKSSTANKKRLVPYRFQKRKDASQDQEELESIFIALTNKSNVHLKVNERSMIRRKSYLDYIKQREMTQAVLPR